MWEYAWYAPSEGWYSDFQYSSYFEASENAVHCALIWLRSRRLGYKGTLPRDKKTIEKLWRSMRRRGWEIRKRKKKDQSQENM